VAADKADEITDTLSATGDNAASLWASMCFQKDKRTPVRRKRRNPGSDPFKPLTHKIGKCLSLFFPAYQYGKPFDTVGWDFVAH
jgi:hypothetical protein